MRALIGAVILTSLSVGCGGGDPEPKPEVADETFDIVAPGGGTPDVTPDATPPVKPLPPSDPRALAVRDLTSEVAADRAEALRVLADAEVDAAIQSKVVKELIGLLTDRDPMIVRRAGSALRAWGRPTDVPAIARYVTDDEADVRQAAIAALGAFATPEAAAAVIVRVGSTIDRAHVMAALVEQGTVCEPGLLEVVEDADNATQLAIVQVLEQVGTRACLDTLIELQMDDGADVAVAAAKAIDVIEGR